MIYSESMAFGMLLPCTQFEGQWMIFMKLSCQCDIKNITAYVGGNAEMSEFSFTRY